MRQERRLRREEAQLARRGQLARISPLRNGSSITKFSEIVNFPNQTSYDYHITGIFFQKIQGPASLLSPQGALEAWLTCIAVASLVVIAPPQPVPTHAHLCFTPSITPSSQQKDTTQTQLQTPSPWLVSIYNSI